MSLVDCADILTRIAYRLVSEESFPTIVLAAITLALNAATLYSAFFASGSTFLLPTFSFFLRVHLISSGSRALPTSRS